MSYGYSLRVSEQNKQASTRSVGVRLGRYCIKEGIPVQKVADMFKVSRQTVYTWFSGTVEPGLLHEGRIKSYLNKVEAK